MKIIKKADASKWSHKFTCGNCASELEAEASDVIYNYYAGDYRDPSYETFSLKCVICNHALTLKTSELPKIIQIEAKNRSKPSSGSFYDR
jgi:transcription elongation factor Elf1